MTEAASDSPTEPAQAANTPSADRSRNDDDLAEVAGRAVLRTAGVAAIEPSLAQAFHQVQRTARRLLSSKAPSDSVADGVRLSTHDGQVDVSVEIAVTGSETALAVARSVRDNVSDTIADAGLHPGHIAVAVLRLDEPDG